MDGMRHRIAISALLGLTLSLFSCSSDTKPVLATSEVKVDPDVFSVSHPELFKLAKVETRDLPSVLNANGSVVPDVSRTIHVTSLGSGRAVDLKVRLGDYVKKGQLLLVISSPDLANASADYEKARADEDLSRRALDRAQLLYSHGALAEKDLQAAQDTEDKAKVDLRTAEEHVRVIGGDPTRPGSLLSLVAPVSGTIVEQNVAGFETVKTPDNTANLFTIADLTQVWVVCDVYENDLGNVHLGDTGDVRLNAYPDKPYHGRITDISRVLDPTTRSDKVRIVLPNPDGSLRPGMYAVVTFRSRKVQPQTVLPGTAVMRLQDKDWVFREEGAGKFRRVEVRGGSGVLDGMQEIQSGVNPGDTVVANALEFSTAAAAENAK